MQHGSVEGGASVGLAPTPGVLVRDIGAQSPRTSIRSLSGDRTGDDRAWDGLGAAAAEPNVFAERWFVQAAAAHLPQGADARAILAWSGGTGAPRLIGSFPFVLAPRYGRMPLRHVASWTHHHCFLGSSMVRAGHEASAWRAILGVLDDAAWARGLLHVTGLVEGGPTHRGLAQAAAQLGRPCDIVHRTERALLRSDLSPQAYYEATVRAKKRKELRRLRSRLAELGPVAVHRLAPGADLGIWCDRFLSLEASGWKGRSGSALASEAGTGRFFRDVVAGAHAAGRLEMIRLDVDARPIAMLVNLFAAPGSFSFKIAYDEAFARYSPGVLVALENYAVLDRPDIAWTDSCAVEDHPMINSLWAERRPVVRVSVPIAGWRRRGVFRVARTAEKLAARLRSRSRPIPSAERSPR
ncbi:MAG TPA: GNAT family N-acetyltransferase [Sphingomonas sp.]|jgi:CelD/BcsL family acetyltransferase involved in cellulose biosynthesis|uniref:GNAT family N-acetyltransferase n=1 Tax=Sphingomonas sp. TaxID=28214 RepID=UPI002ED8D8DD